MKSPKLQKLFTLILACFIMANFGYAQQKQKTQSDESPKKVVIIKKSIDADGTVKTEKIIREGDDIHFDAKDGRVIIEEIEGADGKEIKVEVDYDDLGMDIQKNINVNVEEINGEKRIRVSVHPEDGQERIIEWEGAGDLPEEVRKELEEKGVFLHELEGEGENGVFFLDGDGAHKNFQFKTSTEQSEAFLGVMSAQEEKITIVVDEDGNENKTESSSSDSDGISIGEVIEGSAAAEAGLQEGDVLRTIDGNPLGNFNDLVDFMQDTEIGQKVSIGYERDGQMQQTEATLQERKGEMSNIIIERIIEDEDWDSDEKGNTFFFNSDDADGTKTHKRHRIIVITKSGKEYKEEETEEMPFNALPETQLQRTLQLRELNIAPNPTEGNLRLRFAGEALPTTVKVSDLNGKQMFRERLNRFDGQYDQNIDLSDLPSGVFLLTIEQNDKVHTEQIVVK